MEHRFSRYRPLLDDFDGFLAACRRPLPRAAWINPLRCDPEVVAARIRERCPAARPVPWWPHAYRLPADTSPGNWLEYRLGQLHVQEEATLWPAALLEAGPGDRVLDLCAAPGNKTAQIAVQMRDRGMIVANEKIPGRLAQIRYNAERLGLTSVVLTQGDGARMADPGFRYDHALVDVPCSCEGTSRKRHARREADGAFRRGIQSLQIGLLRKALKLVRPGGTVVYATCTYAPEENERVLDAIWPDFAAIEPLAPPPGVRVDPGIPEWEGRRFRPDVVHAARLWPHHNDTGGFFVAKLRRLG